MTKVSLCFEVHQPLRLKKGFFWDGSIMREVLPGKLVDFYFDDPENSSIFNRVASKCYLPANQLIFEEIKRFQDSEKPFKVAYSFSGIFLDQCRFYNPQVLDSFIRLVDTGQVELLEQTYYHSLTSLYEDKEEFREQVKMHRDLIWDVFGVMPSTFENTELLYNNQIARIVEDMGYKAIFTEGTIADPNHVYRPAGMDISLLLRNYQLTDDVGFRFSLRSWAEYPLTAEKYSAWLAAASGRCLNIFCDYETFGEHQWAETGIFEFLRHLPREVLKWQELSFATPKEIASSIPPEREISIPDDRTVSWADIERDTSCWLGNAMQWACFTYQKRLMAPIKESQDPELLNTWRILGLSDQLYYMFTSGGGPGEVHSYFSPYKSAYDASITYFSVLTDLHYRIKKRLKLADEPFCFATGIDQFVGAPVWTLAGLVRALAVVDITSIEYHMAAGDLANWAQFSLGDERLARRIEGLSQFKGEGLRKRLIRRIRSELDDRYGKA